MTVRSPLAGTWYEADAGRLASEIDAWFEASGRSPDPRVRALVLPHAGYAWSGRVAAEAVAAVRGRAFRRALVLGPSHRVRLENVIALPDREAVGTPLGDVPIDREALAALSGPPFAALPAAHAHEHSVEVEIPLLQRALGGFALVPLVVGALDDETAHAAARALLAIVDEETLVVASSDFTHYGPRFGYVPFEDDVPARIEALDRGALDHLQRRDAEGFDAYVRSTGATICGRHPIGVLLRMLPEDAVFSIDAYDRSGALLGDWEDSVSYVGATCRFEAWPRGGAPPDATRLTAADGACLLALARAALGHFLRTGEERTPEALGIACPERLRRPAAVFVTLRLGGRLRGCIGQVSARLPLARAVVRAAVAAASEDGRFLPVAPGEVDDLALKVSVLGPLRRLRSPEAFRCGEEGIVLTRGGRGATFLPEVAVEQGWDRETTLTMLAHKAGLPPDAWREARLEAFTSQVFEDPGPA